MEYYPAYPDGDNYTADNYYNNSGSSSVNEISKDGYGSYYYDYYGYYDDYIYSDHLYAIFHFELPVYAYLWPIMVFIMSGANVLVIAGFLRKHMRNATNVILISIAISDTLTGLATLPATFYVYSAENEFLTAEWCEAVMLLKHYVSRAFHTVSVWQTVLLGFHRYIQVCCPARAKWCTKRNTFIAIVSIYIFAFILHMYHAFDAKVDNGFCHWTIEEPCKETCIYLWFVLLLVHLIPCTLLLIFTIRMTLMLRRSNYMPSSEETSETLIMTSRRRSEQNKRITLVVVVVMIIFLVPELPYGIFYLIIVGQRHSYKRIFALGTNRMVHCVYELLLIVSFHSNFWVYCLMIQKFRAGLKNIVRGISCHMVSDQRNVDESLLDTKSVTEIQMLDLKVMPQSETGLREDVRRPT